MGNTDKFDMIADQYDTEERINIAKRSSDAIRFYLTDTKDKNAIDFGCGTGLVGMNLLDEFNSVLFLDSSSNMIHKVKQKITQFSIHNADTLCIDFEKEDCENIHSDYIIIVQVLLHIKEIEPILSKLYSLLNEGGHLLIVDYNKNDEITSDMVHNGFDQVNLSQILNNMGYRNIQFKTFYSGNKIFMGHDAELFILDAVK